MIPDAASPRIAELKSRMGEPGSTLWCIRQFTAEDLAVLLAQGEEQDKTITELKDLNQKVTQQRDEYRTLSGIGVWHADCRPNREMAARELQKSQAIIDKLADAIALKEKQIELESTRAEAAERERDALRKTLRALAEKWRAHARCHLVKPPGGKVTLSEMNAAYRMISDAQFACADELDAVLGAPARPSTVEHEEQDDHAR